MNNLSKLRCITQKELCELSKLSEDYWREVRRKGEIEYEKFGTTIRYTQEDLENYYNKHKIKAK